MPLLSNFIISFEHFLLGLSNSNFTFLFKSYVPSQ